MFHEIPGMLVRVHVGLHVYFNSYNPVQLSGWRVNVDMQYIVSRHRVIEYRTKYVTKSEPRSQSLKEVFTTIVHSLKEGNNSLKAVQKILINSVGEITQLRRHATFCCSFPCSNRHVILLF